MPELESQLSKRDREILREVIQTYLLSGEPVSSRRVSRRPDQTLSAASIRNVMADLEELGYLSQPHTSAGRVPTEAGYHLFIDDLMAAEQVGEEERRLIDDSLRSVETGRGDLANVTSQLLSQLTHHVGVVLVPAMERTILRAVEFVPLTGNKLLCVVVAQNGFVESKLLVTEEPIPREQLVRIGNYLNENFAGRSLGEIRSQLLSRLSAERAKMDAWMRQAVALAGQGLAVADEPELVVGGAQSLLAQPGLEDLEKVRALFDLFTEKVQLVGLLNMCLEGEGVRVLIGQDSELTSELDFSLIVRRYRHGDETVGTLGILGPARMEYPRIVPLVDYLGDRLSEALLRTM